MAQPITWRTIENNNNPAVISNIFDSAGKNLNGGLNALTGIFKDTAAIQDRNMTAIDEAAKSAYLDQLAGAKTPEALAALQASGQLDAARLGLSAASRTAVRGADEARTTAVNALTTAGQQFGINQQDFRDAPILEQVAQLRASGKTTEADALIANNPQLRVAAPAIAANRVEKLRRVQDARTVISQGQDDALALVKSPNDIAAEKFKTVMRPTTQTNALAEGALKTIDLSNQTNESTNKARDQVVEKLTAAAQQAYQAEQLKQGGKLSDTAAMEAHLRALNADPRLSAADISRNQPKIQAAFNTVAARMPIGNDALAKAAKQAEEDVIQKEGDARNRFAPDSPDGKNAYEKLAETVKAELDPSASEDNPDLQKMLTRFATKGIEIRPGVFVTPSVTDILGATRGYTTNFGGNFLNKTRANDIEAELKKTLADVDVTSLLIEREKSLKANRARDVRNILNPLTPALGPLNPLNLPPPPGKK